VYTNNELFFPHHVIPMLQTLRGPQWEDLICHLNRLPECHEEKIAFMLMMARLNGCVACETDSYRAMRGCHACTVQTLRRYKGTDADLIALYHRAQADLRGFVAQGHPAARLVQASDPA
jgi:hypothetical protein